MSYLIDKPDAELRKLAFEQASILANNNANIAYLRARNDTAQGYLNAIDAEINRRKAREASQ